MKALRMLQKWNNGNYPSKQEINEAIAELEALENDLKDLFSCIELTEDENSEKRLASMETYLIRLSRSLK